MNKIDNLTTQVSRNDIDYQQTESKPILSRNIGMKNNIASQLSLLDGSPQQKFNSKQLDQNTKSTFQLPTGGIYTEGSEEDLLEGINQSSP